MEDYVNIHTYSFAEYTQKDLGLIDFSTTETVLNFPENLHSHDFIEMIYIKKGTGILNVNGESHPFKEGALIRLFSFHIHSLQNTNTESVEYIQCQFPLSVLIYLDVDLSKRYSSYYILEHLPPIVQLTQEQKKKVHYAFLAIIQENNLKDVYRENMIIAELTKITLLFERAACRLESRQSDENRSVIWKALQFMHLHFNQEISAEKVAQQFDLTIIQLNHCIYQITGKTFMENLHEIRIRNACAMMPFSELSITYIHQYVGYQSPATFYRIFKKMKGVSPEVYRQQNLNSDLAITEKADSVWKILMYMANHFRDSLTVSSASQALFISPDTIKENLKRHLSLNFYELLLIIRMSFACALLKTTKLEIGYIASHVGYNSLRTFNRNFKDYLGVSPRQYRKEGQTDLEQNSQPHPTLQTYK